MTLEQHAQEFYRKKAIQEGRREGRQEVRQEVALNLIVAGNLSLEEIADVTDFTVQHLAQLRREYIWSIEHKLIMEYQRSYLTHLFNIFCSKKPVVANSEDGKTQGRGP